MTDTLHVGCNGPTLVLRAVRRYGERPAFVSREQVITYRAIGDFIGRAQRVLVAEGVGKDEFVAILARNGAEAWMLGVAAHGLGARLVNLHPMGSLQDHLQCIAATDARYVFVDPRAFPGRGAEIAAAGIDARVLALGPADFGGDVLARIEAAGSSAPQDLSDPHAISAAHFTGGTTGVPKQIMSRHRRNAAGTAAFCANFELPDVPRVLATGPITHVTGSLLLPTLIRGGSIHMLPGFDVEQVISTVESERINTALMVPTMIYTLLDAPALRGADMSSLEFLLYSASPMSPTRLVEAIDRLGPVFAQLYAQSECGPITYMPKADHDPAHPERFAACGFAVPECVVRLVDGDGEEVAAGDAGEICVRAAHAFEGYHNNEEATAQALRNGWLHTGDIARADEEGRLYIVDRKKDMIVTGGFNVYPREVEDAISTLPEIAACAVVGAPDDRWGEAVHAYVVLKPGSELTDAAIMATVKKLKGSVQAPKAVQFVNALPTTAVGKIDKKPLREALWAGASRQVN